VGPRGSGLRVFYQGAVVDFWACAFIGVRWAHRSAGLAREDRWAPRGGREHQLLPSPCGARLSVTSVVMTRMGGEFF
jgi:hypothetical protein